MITVNQENIAIGEEDGSYNYYVYWDDCYGDFVFDISTTSKTTILPNDLINGLDEQYN